MNRTLSSYFDDLSDVFCTVDIQVDTKKHVKPIETKPVVKNNNAPEAIVIDKFKTLTKYTFYESGKNWVKVMLEFKGIKDHPKEKITYEFKKRGFELKVFDYLGSNYQFACPKL